MNYTELTLATFMYSSKQRFFQQPLKVTGLILIYEFGHDIMFTELEYYSDGLLYSTGRKELSAIFWPNLGYAKELLFLHVGWCVQFVCLFLFM